MDESERLKQKITMLIVEAKAIQHSKEDVFETMVQRIGELSTRYEVITGKPYRFPIYDGTMWDMWWNNDSTLLSNLHLLKMRTQNRYYEWYKE